MMRMTVALALLFAIAPVFSPAGWLEAAETVKTHTGKGTLLSVDAKAGRVVMTEASGTHTLAVNQQTKIVDETGQIMSVTSLGLGDLVREECLVEEQGEGVARQIRLLRPAWKDLASPEM